MAKFRNLATEYARLEQQVGRDKTNLMTSEHERETAKAEAMCVASNVACEPTESQVL